MAAIAVRAQELNSKLSALSENSWIYLNPKPSLRYFPIYANPEATEALTETDRVETREPQGRSYTGIVYGDSKIFYFGGAHGSYPGNDVEMYDIAQNIWIQSYKPNVAPANDPAYGGGGSPNSYVDPRTGEVRPYQIHGYGRTTYHAGLKLYVCTASFCEKTRYNESTKEWECSYGSNLRVSLIGFDPKQKKWELLVAADKLPWDDDHGQLSDYDEELGGILLTGERSDVGIWLFRDKNSNLTKLNYDGPRLSSVGGSPSIYIPDIRSHLFAILPQSNGVTVRLILYNSIRESWEEIAVPDLIKARIGSDGNFAMAYDRLNKKVIVMQTEDPEVPSPIDIWIYDPIAKSWSNLGTSPSSPIRRPFSVVNREPIQYDPIHNVIIMVYTKKTHQQGEPGFVETWAYRYKSGRSTTSIEDSVGKEKTPSKFRLLQNYPNPFNSSTNIAYQITSTSYVSFEIYDTRGKRIDSLVSEIQSPGSHRVSWGKGYPSGVYFLRILVSDDRNKIPYYTSAKKLILLK